jgi:hypothetical protein
MTKFSPRQLLVHAVLALALVAASAPSFAQYRDRGDRRMSGEERQRLRDDMHSARRDAYRDPRQFDPRDPRQRGYSGYPPPPPPPPGYRMSPEDREQLRRDMYEANRGIPRR